MPIDFNEIMVCRNGYSTAKLKALMMETCLSGGDKRVTRMLKRGWNEQFCAICAQKMTFCAFVVQKSDTDRDNNHAKEKCVVGWATTSPGLLFTSPGFEKNSPGLFFRSPGDSKSSARVR